MNNAVGEINNYFQMTPSIATSGQPSADQIKAISKQGYTTVINLTPHINQDVLPNEGQLVATSFMSYINIPVLYEDPQLDQFDMFCKMMDAFSDQKIWIHCVKNSRCSAFIYLYMHFRLGYPSEEARSSMFEQWVPDETWEEFMQEVVDDLEEKGMLFKKRDLNAA